MKLAATRYVAGPGRAEGDVTGAIDIRKRQISAPAAKLNSAKGNNPPLVPVSGNNRHPACIVDQAGSITYQPASQPANQTSTSTVHPKPPFNCMLKAIILAGILLRIVLFLTPAHNILQSRPELSTPLTSWRSR